MMCHGWVGPHTYISSAKETNSLSIELTERSLVQWVISSSFLNLLYSSPQTKRSPWKVQHQYSTVLTTPKWWVRIHVAFTLCGKSVKSLVTNGDAGTKLRSNCCSVVNESTAYWSSVLQCPQCWLNGTVDVARYWTTESSYSHKSVAQWYNIILVLTKQRSHPHNQEAAIPHL